MRSQRPAEFNDRDRNHMIEQAALEKLRRSIDAGEATAHPSGLFTSDDMAASRPEEFLHQYMDGILDSDLDSLMYARDRDDCRRALHRIVDNLKDYDYPEWPWLSAWLQRGLHRSILFVKRLNWGLLAAVSFCAVCWALIYLLIRHI